MKKLLLGLTLIFLLTGSSKTHQWHYELPLTSIAQNDSIPTIDQFGRVRNGIIVQQIVDTLNTDPSGVDLTQTEVSAIRAIVGGMYIDGTWQKSKAIYPFIGSNEWKHKWNIKDMRDLDVAFRLVFVGGGWVHSATGAKPDGTVYAETYLNPSTQLTLNSTHISMYSGTNVTTDVYNIVASLSGNLMGLYANFNGNIFNSQYNGGNGRIASSETRGDGYFLINRQSSSSNSTYRNGLLKGFSSASSSIGSLPNANFLLGAISAGDASNRGVKQYRLVTIGEGLTDQQSISLSHTVKYTQQILNRE